MAIGSVNGNYSSVQGYFTQDGQLIKNMTSLADQKKAASAQNKNSSYFNDSLFSKLGSISDAASALKSQISGMASLTQYSSSIEKIASYTDKDILSASVSKGAPVSGATKTDVNVSQLATGQQNTGAGLKADENSFGSQFSISITNGEGKTSSFNVGLAEDDNNKSAFQAMAEKINASNIGVRASMIEDKENGTVSLQLTSEKTGETDGKFTVRDESAANLGNVSRESQNANYSVNGVNYASQSNDVSLASGVTATLNKTGSTQISYGANAEKAVDSVKSFVDDFNSLKDAASGSPALAKQMNDLVSNYGRALGNSGIGIDSSGKLSVTDEGKLTQSISDGSFAKNFQGVGSFGSNLSNVAQNAYRTAYNSAVQESFNDLMNNSSDSAASVRDLMLNNLNSSAGAILNMLV